MNPSAPAYALLITLDDALVALLVRMREPFLRVVAGAPDCAEVDLSLVRIPDDWLIFPAPDREMNAPRHPDGVTKQFTKRAEKILGFSIRLHDLRVSYGTWLLDQGEPVHVLAKRLGHDASILLEVYAKRTQRGDEKAAETTNRLTRGLIGPS
jgi:integrase